jgi:hypothetical protein
MGYAVELLVNGVWVVQGFGDQRVFSAYGDAADAADYLVAEEGCVRVRGVRVRDTDACPKRSFLAHLVEQCQEDPEGGWYDMGVGSPLRAALDRVAEDAGVEGLSADDPEERDAWLQVVAWQVWCAGRAQVEHYFEPVAGMYEEAVGEAYDAAVGRA